MAIYTRFGNEITIVEAQQNHGEIYVLAEYKGYPGEFDKFHILDLKADYGLSEITNNPIIAKLLNSQNS